MQGNLYYPNTEINRPSVTFLNQSDFTAVELTRNIIQEEVSLMPFNLENSIQILERTPEVLEALLSGLSDDWTKVNEGGESWSPNDIVGHLLHGERTDE